VVHFVLASSIWLQEGPPVTDLIAIVKGRRNAAIFAVVLGFLTGWGRTTAREHTCASSTPNSEAWSTRPVAALHRVEFYFLGPSNLELLQGPEGQAPLDRPGSRQESQLG
jgi:hypothetical protein